MTTQKSITPVEQITCDDLYVFYVRKRKEILPMEFFSLIDLCSILKDSWLSHFLVTHCIMTLV